MTSSTTDDVGQPPRTGTGGTPETILDAPGHRPAAPAAELRDGAVLNFGFGIPDAVAKLIAVRANRRAIIRLSSTAPMAAPCSQAP